MAITYGFAAGTQSVGEGTCVCCGMVTSDRVKCFIECEKPWVKGKHSFIFWLFLVWLFGWLSIFYGLAKDDPEVVGEQKTYEIPISMCENCQADGTEEGSLRAILSRQPDFAGLLRKYPSAKVWASVQKS
jgi:hypothetical protein